ncbi:hypothetical protein [Acuticoccus sp.]|uniref:hypothetical protein n=1 Tax=Acuticoccus sp. TaxID=1904378 RepID=UPI003B5228DB
MEGVISTRTIVLIEVVMIFGGLVGFCLWQIWSTRRAIAARKAREAAGEEPQQGAD